LTPDEVHALGHQEVRRIQTEIAELLPTIGIPDTGAFTTKLGAYAEYANNRTDETFFYPLTEEGRQQTLKDYQAIVDSMYMKLPEMFAKIPEIPVRVKRVPEYKEKTAGTYYQPPSLRGESEGTFYANLSYQHNKAGMKALTYHEAIPGHHFQMALEQESPDSRLFKALFFFTGFVEGWALYAEKLAKEYGCYTDIHSKISALRSELFRAARLVVDTGIHAKKWTRDQALQYMFDNVGWGWYGEIDRYIAWPGQACAYKIGELKILELRKRAKTELGEKFDIKDFHEVVLKYGSVPLDVLEEIVNEYIELKKQ
jgi:uncharacterized protein (DUF885 family)